MQARLGKILLQLAKDDRRALLELLQESYSGESGEVFSAVGEVESGDTISYCHDCGATGDGEEYCGACRSYRVSHGEIIEPLDILALENGNYADIQNSASMDDNDF